MEDNNHKIPAHQQWGRQEPLNPVQAADQLAHLQAMASRAHHPDNNMNRKYAASYLFCTGAGTAAACTAGFIYDEAKMHYGILAFVILGFLLLALGWFFYRKAGSLTRHEKRLQKISTLITLPILLAIFIPRFVLDKNVSLWFLLVTLLPSLLISLMALKPPHFVNAPAPYRR